MPIVVDWNSDGAKDLVVGALGGVINIFFNEGTDTAPDFRVRAYAQEDGGILSVPSLRSSPCVHDVDHDGKKDLLTGNTNGQVLFYANVGTDADPTFSGFATFAGPFLEMLLVGHLAMRAGLNEPVEWDGVNMQCTNLPELSQYVTRQYRKGWRL